MKKTLTLAARKSDLARIQAYIVGKAIEIFHPKIQMNYKFSSSLGDDNPDLDLTSLPDQGVFTRDLHQQLIRGEVDLVVHSWKDLPTKSSGETEVAATMAREDMRDLLIIPKEQLSVVKSRGALEILSSSPRRQYNLQPLIPKLWPHDLDKIVFKPIRGNVPTRFHKLFQGTGQALIVAKAAVDRILATEWEEFLEVKVRLQRLIEYSQWMVLPLCKNPCAPAQGALAVEISKSARGLKELLMELNCEETQKSVSKEREILSNYGGGCHQKIGVSLLKRNYGEILSLRGLTERDKTLNQWGLLNKKTFEGKIWDPKKSLWFEREPLNWKNPLFDRPLWVAKSEALPQGSICHHLIWTSGIKTWEKLASRGYWVNGSAESLGEKEKTRLGKHFRKS